ncbi:MAG: nitrilase [Candidatus Azotimanducaceae bacterium]|jgi:nitrilase
MKSVITELNAMPEIQKEKDLLTVALAQISPIWLNKLKTLDKICSAISEAAAQGSQLVVFGEALLPGYPFWIERTNGAAFNSTTQKDLYAHYLDQAVCPEHGDLDEVCRLAKQHHIAIYLGTIEKAANRGGHSLYCSMIYIDQAGEIRSVHRKLMPTYEERLAWSPGDGHGLVTHPLGAFTVGGLNCWENWMPLPRAALYALGEDLHVAIWPGNESNTEDLTRVLAKEGRSYVMSVSGLMRSEDFPEDTPHLDEILAGGPKGMIANGGSCLAAPDGTWIIPPVIDKEVVLVATIDHQQVRAERQNFDPSGHYSRPDVTQLTVNRQRQEIAKFID